MDFDNTNEIITPTKTTSLTIGGTGALFIPTGTTAQRPSSPQSGYIRFNTTNVALEFYNSTAVAWQTFGNSSLNALLAVSGTGVLTQTSSGAYAARTITGTANRLSVTNGDGVSGNPTLDISSAYVGQTSITTLGTIGTGTWQGTVVGAVYGGTGQSSYAVGDILYASSTTALSKLADVATGNALISGGVSTAPSWGKIGLTTHVSGTLATSNGGTGLSTIGTALQILRVNAAGTGLEYASGGSGTVTSVAATQPSAGLTITGSPITTSGTLVFALANDLAAVEGLSTTGIATRTATDTWTTRTITGTTNTITVTNGSGVAGNPTITIADNPVFPGTAAITVTSGTTAQRPGTPVNGMIRYNSTLGYTELYQNGTWYKIGITTPGAVGIVAVYTGSIPAFSSSAQVPYDNTVPTSTEGAQVWSTSITPVSTSSTFKFTVPFTVDISTNNQATIISLFRGTTNIGSAIQYSTGGGRPTTMTLSFTDNPNTTSSVTYSMRAGAQGATVFVNSTNSGNNLGGALVSSYEIVEVL